MKPCSYFECATLPSIKSTDSNHVADRINIPVLFRREYKRNVYRGLIITT